MHQARILLKKCQSSLNAKLGTEKLQQAGRMVHGCRGSLEWIQNPVAWEHPGIRRSAEISQFLGRMTVVVQHIDQDDDVRLVFDSFDLEELPTSCWVPYPETPKLSTSTGCALALESCLKLSRESFLCGNAIARDYVVTQDQDALYACWPGKRIFVIAECRRY